MQPIRLFVCLGMALAFAACSAPAPTPTPPTLVPTVDVAAIQTQAAVAIFATQTASVPTITPTSEATPTPRPTSTKVFTSTPRPTLTPDTSAQIPPRKQYNHNFEVTEEYDRIQDVTVAALALRVQDGYKLPGGLVAFFEYKGTQPAIPAFVEFGFISTSADWQYLTCHNLALLLDGETRLAPKTEQMGDVITGGVVETIATRLPVSDFLKIVNAKQVEGKVCNTEFTLTSEQMEALRDVASRMLP